MVQTIGSASLQQQMGDTTWIAIRARGAEWSWLTREDAASLARRLMALCPMHDEEDKADRQPLFGSN